MGAATVDGEESHRMIFDIDFNIGIGIDGAAGSDRSGYVRASREALADLVRRPEDLRALCDAGFPQSPFRMVPAIAADDCEVETTSVVDLGCEAQVARLDSGDLLLFGSVQGWYLFLHLGDGTVHAFPDEMALFDGDFRPVHTDLSSLRHMLELLHRRKLLMRREPTGPVIVGRPYAELTRFADGVRDEFDGVDPLVFSLESDQESPWIFFFADLVSGMYDPVY
ncbi:SUKH-4 family immunity protein [Streptomyces sp. NBC_00341]|uniref:SUKH-4 family immunity protein n=1 Tax=Streptomyces sp. NBC_00341 TaxID=2975717 RepID=UPI00308D2A46|nr:SUKH-4 family immunity protein [Streptomyces sp. NBC_00341]